MAESKDTTESILTHHYMAQLDSGMEYIQTLLRNDGPLVYLTCLVIHIFSITTK